MIPLLEAKPQKNRGTQNYLLGSQSNYCQMLIVFPGFNFSYLESKKEIILNFRKKIDMNWP